MRVLYFAALAVALPLSARAEITVSDPWARASVLASRPGAAYLTLVRDGDDRLIEASSSVAEGIMVHATETDDAGLSRMKHIPAVELPAGEVVAFAPGGMHLMLRGLSMKLVEGATFPLTLRFENANEITIDVPILGVGATGPEGEEQ